MQSDKLHILLMGQTPPPWHGQAVATQLLFDHDWPDFEVHRLRMEFSEEMLEVGRFQWKKVAHLFHLIRSARKILKANPGCVLFYPPASAKWIPFLRDVAFLISLRHLAGSTVFIFHASGLPVFVKNGRLRGLLGNMVYHHAEVSLEVAQELITPHQAFTAQTWQWCPCAIDVPELNREPLTTPGHFTALFVGSLQEGKGVLEILRTAAILKQQGRADDFRFRIVGKWFSTEFEDEVRLLRAELGLEDMVELVGQLTGDAKWDAYRNADVFFFPTHYASEATPIVLMEALGMGLPLVSTEWAGIPAMLDGCASARILPIKSPERYAAELIELASGKTPAAEISGISRKFYQANFLPARFIERVGASWKTAAALNRKAGLPVHSLAPEPTARTGKAESPDITPGLTLSVYLADQNPGHDRSFGISRMSQVVLEALQATGQVKIEVIASKTSQQAPESLGPSSILPWGTRRKSVRLLTDHFHPLFKRSGPAPDLHYFPKGYLPLLSFRCRPSVVTIHDTIIQYDEDHYPNWRNPWEYYYWAKMLKHTLRKADRILTVSESSKGQIRDFMRRHEIAPKEIIVTYEPCLYERIPQPAEPAKENYVIHLASCEPHKRTAHLVRWWNEAESRGRQMPMLHLIGTVPPEVSDLLANSRSIVKRPFLADAALQAAYMEAKALILPSEIEGFGLPALEAYYLGTPVCFVEGTSVEEILGVVTDKGAFSLQSPDSLFTALDEVMCMNSTEIRECGLKLRDTYAAKKVAEKILSAFHGITV
ncbi:MAG: glycosyltransferase [Luteolibacter sp.]|uniref:glycosyltransferase family 4 protein n=1 Tax=Luteolibacter sp. TaxID=1962973 RepID=UPI003264C14D